MNRTNIDSHFNDTEPSDSAVGNDEIVLDNHEEDYDNHETPPRATKRAKTTTVQSQEYTHSTDNDSRSRIPLTDVTNDSFVGAVNAESSSENVNTNATTIQFDPIQYKGEEWTLPLRKVKTMVYICYLKYTSAISNN